MSVDAADGIARFGLVLRRPGSQKECAEHDDAVHLLDRADDHALATLGYTLAFGGRGRL